MAAALSEAIRGAELRFEPGEQPALLDLLERLPTGAGAVICLGNSSWLDYYALLAPEAIKISATSLEELQGLIVFAEMAMQQGAVEFLVADVEGLVSAFGSAWTGFFIRSVVRLAGRHRARITVTVNRADLGEGQLQVVSEACANPGVGVRIEAATRSVGQSAIPPAAREQLLQMLVPHLR